MNTMLKKEYIKVKVLASTWEDAIREGAKILEDAGCITSEYVDAIFESFKEHGPYMVIAPGVVLSHAKPGDYILKNAISLINLKEGVNFGNERNDPAYLIITLATKDSTSHLSTLQKVTKVLMDSEKLEVLKKSDSKEEIVNILF